jgi:glycosyltransferase involved in cell wall biosynthesis
LVEDAKCGVYVEPENVDEYNKHIRTYLNDPNRLNREGANGYDYAKINFDRNRLAIKYINEIEEKAL